LPVPTAGGVQVEGVALATSAPIQPIDLLGGILLAVGGLLMATVAISALRRQGRHS